VFASSVAVYGMVGLESVLESRTPEPTLSYGAHKWATELLLADYSRRGELDACSLRLPGIVARPSAETGHGSAFMSHIFHALLSARTYTCPVSADATAWWMSRQRCLDNLIHAAGLPAAAMPASRCWQPPVLQASVAEVVQAIAQRLGRDPQAWIRYAPDARIEALFGRQPPVLTPRAEAAGFAHDGSVHALVEHVLTELLRAEG
jgi:nucleoside-diphosphate-sugar epimerase